MGISRTPNLAPGASYPHLNVRRMTAEMPGDYATLSYQLTPAAAEAVDRHPQAMLYHRLYNMHMAGIPFVYKVNGQAVLAVETNTFSCMAEVGRPSAGNMVVVAPQEMPSNVKCQEVDLEDNMPSVFLPYDLSMIKAVHEATPGLVNQDDPTTFYLGACPFRVYHAFHLLTRYPNVLQKRILSMQKVVEVGSGLGIISYVISQLLPKNTQIQGTEIEPNLVVAASKMKRVLQQLSYDVSNVSFRKADIRDQDLSDVDAVIGWFPLGEGISAREIIEVFKRMPKGGLVFQLFNHSPLDQHNAEANGFRLVQPGFPPIFAFRVYERI